jgi:hypothetical protein
MEEELKRTKDETKDELVALTAKLKEITEKLKAEDLDQDTFDDLMKESQDIFEKITKSFSELSKHKEAEREEETTLMSKEDKAGGGKRTFRKKSSSRKKRTRRKRRGR